MNYHPLALTPWVECQVHLDSVLQYGDYYSRDDDLLIDHLFWLDAIVWPGSPAELHPVADLNLDVTPARNIPIYGRLHLT